MGKVMLAFTMSLDGFIAGPDIDVDHAMGRGGERLHDWMFKNHPGRARDDELVKESSAENGAVVLGRRTFDVGLQHWGGDTPYPVPSFVLTHEKRDPLPMKSAAFTFVNDGIDSALRQARDAAGNKDIVVMGANAAQQILKAGLADEMFITLAPVLLCGGTRLFDNIGDQHIELVTTMTVESAVITHFRFRVRRPEPAAA